MSDLSVENRVLNERQHPNRARANQKRVISNTIKNTREHLTSDSGLSLDFDRDMMIAHARNFKAAGFLMPSFIMFMAMFSLAWYDYIHVVLWLFASLLTQTLLVYQNNRFLKILPTERNDLDKWRHTFTCGDLLSGIIWSTFLIIPVSVTSLSQPVFVFSTLLVVVALYSVIAAPIFAGLLAATTPVTMVLFLTFLQSGYVSQMMMAGLFVVAQVLFILVGKQVKDALLQLFAVKAEKDGLIDRKSVV